MKQTDLYQSVLKQAREIKTLETVLELLTWDQETLLPSAGHQHRAEQKALLSGVLHAKKLDDDYYKNLEVLLPHATDNSNESIIVRRLHRDISHARKLPTSFVQEISKTTSEAFTAWQKARESSSWKIFEPHLAKIVDLLRQKSELLGFQNHPLDPLLDEHDPEITVATINPLFSSLKPKLTSLIDDIKQTSWYGTTSRTDNTTFAQQYAICKDAVSLLGFDWNRGRMDTSMHPFSTGLHPTDSRITIRSHSNDLLDQVMSALHEAGHGLYEMGLNEAFFGTPLGEAVSLSIHESQSRLFETVIGRGKAFSKPLAQLLSAHLSGTALGNPDTLYRALNTVRCSPIRTMADEATYPLHVILRFEIEKELFDGTLAVQDLPERWNAGMQAMLGITPENDTSGCLQDVHWSLGSFGYFPTYALGSLYAICFYSAMKQSLPNLESLIETATFEPIRAWLHDHVWSFGRRFNSKDLVTKALGRPPSEEDYLLYLKQKYLI